MLACDLSRGSHDWGYRDALARNLFQNADAAAAVVMARNGLSAGTLAPGEHNQIRQAILGPASMFSKALRARYDGDFTYEPQDIFLKTKLAALTPALNVPGDALTVILARLKSCQVLARRCQRPGRRCAPNRSPLLCGIDRLPPRQVPPTGSLSKSVVISHLRRTRARMRTRSGSKFSVCPLITPRRQRYKGFMVPEIVAAYEAVTPSTRTPLITQKTVKRRLRRCPTLGLPRSPGRLVEQNIFSGFRFAAAKRVSEQRAMSTPEELAQLFASPVWSGCRVGNAEESARLANHQGWRDSGFLSSRCSLACVGKRFASFTLRTCGRPRASGTSI